MGWRNLHSQILAVEPRGSLLGPEPGLPAPRSVGEGRICRGVPVSHAAHVQLGSISACSYLAKYVQLGLGVRAADGPPWDGPPRRAQARIGSGIPTPVAASHWAKPSSRANAVHERAPNSFTSASGAKTRPNNAVQPHLEQAPGFLATPCAPRVSPRAPCRRAPSSLAFLPSETPDLL